MRLAISSSWIRQRGAAVRWGWLVTTLALGAVVIASAWANYGSALTAADDLIRGEAHTLRDAVLATSRAHDERRADLDSLVAAQQEGGLRYAAWVTLAGSVLASGGQADPAPLQVPAATRNPLFVRLGHRVRVYFPPPAPPAGAATPTDHPLPPTIVMEFEPVVAADMLARGRRSLAVAGLVAAVLMAAGLVFWRMSQRIEEGERRTAEQRRLLALGEMSAVLAHEIRNPLASLKGHAQLLVERLANDSVQRRKAARVVEEATRLEVLTSDLLDFVRSGPIDLRPVDPAALLRAAAAELSDGAVEVEGAAAGAGTPDRWPLDERRFRQAVLVNLLRNAAQASPPDRPPRARAALEHGSLVFTIRDFGPGLPPGNEERMFDPFFTTRPTGTGLGLAVARRIVELHGGRIEAANAPAGGGGGAVFRIVLPRREG